MFIFYIFSKQISLTNNTSTNTQNNIQWIHNKPSPKTSHLDLGISNEDWNLKKVCLVLPQSVSAQQILNSSEYQKKKPTKPSFSIFEMEEVSRESININKISVSFETKATNFSNGFLIKLSEDIVKFNDLNSLSKKKILKAILMKIYSKHFLFAKDKGCTVLVIPIHNLKDQSGDEVLENSKENSIETAKVVEEVFKKMYEEDFDLKKLKVRLYNE